MEYQYEALLMREDLPFVVTLKFDDNGRSEDEQKSEIIEKVISNLGTFEGVIKITKVDKRLLDSLPDK